MCNKFYIKKNWHAAWHTNGGQRQQYAQLGPAAVAVGGRHGRAARAVARWPSCRGWCIPEVAGAAHDRGDGCGDGRDGSGPRWRTARVGQPMAALAAVKAEGERLGPHMAVVTAQGHSGGWREGGRT